MHKSRTRAKTDAAERTGDGIMTYPRRPRPAAWPEANMPSVPRLAVGTSEYLHALSLRDHAAVR